MTTDNVRVDRIPPEAPNKGDFAPIDRSLRPISSSTLRTGIALTREGLGSP
jgi:hypothetical protein